MIMVEPGPSRRPRRHPPPQKQPPPQPRNRPAQNEDVIDEAELRRMTHDERRELARALAAIDVPHPLLDPRLRRRRRLGLLILTACCIGLVGWIAILLLTLPGHYTSTDWQTVWVGLDIAELLAFAATAWAAWHERQVVIFLMIITGTLLVCDAWFDVTLSYGSSDFTASILSAVLVELPLAFLMFAGGRRRRCGGSRCSPTAWESASRPGSGREPTRSQPETVPRLKGKMTAKRSNVDASDYTQYRPLMFSIAYRMTGSVSDAEDIVQEAFLRATRNKTKDKQPNNR